MTTTQELFTKFATIEKPSLKMLSDIAQEMTGCNEEEGNLLVMHWNNPLSNLHLSDDRKSNAQVEKCIQELIDGKTSLSFTRKDRDDRKRRNNK